MGVTANGAQFLCLRQKNIRYFPINKDLWIFLLSVCQVLMHADQSWCLFLPPPSERLEPRNQTLSFQYKMAFVSNNCLKSFVT